MVSEGRCPQNSTTTTTAGPIITTTYVIVITTLSLVGFLIADDCDSRLLSRNIFRGRSSLSFPTDYTIADGCTENCTGLSGIACRSPNQGRILKYKGKDPYILLTIVVNNFNIGSSKSRFHLTILTNEKRNKIVLQYLFISSIYNK